MSASVLKPLLLVLTLMFTSQIANSPSYTYPLSHRMACRTVFPVDSTVRLFAEPLHTDRRKVSGGLSSFVSEQRLNRHISLTPTSETACLSSPPKNLDNPKSASLTLPAEVKRTVGRNVICGKSGYTISKGVIASGPDMPFSGLISRCRRVQPPKYE